METIALRAIATPRFRVIVSILSFAVYFKGFIPKPHNAEVLLAAVTGVTGVFVASRSLHWPCC